MTVSAVSSVNYTGNRSTVVDHNRDNRISASEVGVATGATAGGAQMSYKLLKRFQSVTKGKNPAALSAETAQRIKDLANADRQVVSLWKKIGVNAAKYKEAIVNFAKKTATGKFASRIVATPIFKKAAGLVGGLGALFVFISGIGEMGNTFGKVFNRTEIMNDFEAYEV